MGTACHGWGKRKAPPSQLSAASAIASRWSRRRVLTASRACYRSAFFMVIDALASARVTLWSRPSTLAAPAVASSRVSRAKAFFYRSKIIRVACLGANIFLARLNHSIAPPVVLHWYVTTKSDIGRCIELKEVWQQSSIWQARFGLPTTTCWSGPTGILRV